MLPSNGSLHEDLILEELEVFQVSSASLPLTDVTSSSAKSGGGGLGQSRQWRVAFHSWGAGKHARQVVAGATTGSSLWSHDSFEPPKFSDDSVINGTEGM